jgi:hypothetical protein
MLRYCGDGDVRAHEVRQLNCIVNLKTARALDLARDVPVLLMKVRSFHTTKTFLGHERPILLCCTTQFLPNDMLRCGPRPEGETERRREFISLLGSTIAWPRLK